MSVRRTAEAALRSTLGALRKHWRGALLCCLGTLLAPWALLLLTAAFTSLPQVLREPIPEQSLRFEDRNGHLLREVRTSDGELARWLPLDQVPPFFLEALIAVEDRHFYQHPGVDPFALVRALGQWLGNQRIISGASTLSMQLARNLRTRPRTLFGKFSEMALALRIEATLSKREVLEQYVNRIDFGPNLRGLAAASHSYFARSPAQLSDAELALLAGLPQSPTSYALFGDSSRALRRRDRVLQRMVEENKLSAPDAAKLSDMGLDVAERRSAFGAPHFVTQLLLGRFANVQPALADLRANGTFRVRTTLDSELQRAAEVAIKRSLERLRANDVSAAAAVLLDNETGDILAYVGSPDFYSAKNQGEVDGVNALRQPGSTLKPFVYAAAFEELDYNPATVLADVELRIDTPQGSYAPRNFDDRFRGPVRLRDALANSINVPAVRTAIALGPDTLLRHLHALGFDSLQQSADYYGPALALGDGEVTLLELTRAYATLAARGTERPLRAVLETEQVNGGGVTTRAFSQAERKRLVPEVNASWITDILKDPLARAQTFGRGSSLEFEFDVAAKTGTSKGFRDNWVVGYTDRFTLGVWVGNFDGRPMLNVGGATGAAPIFASILRAAVMRSAAGPLPLQDGGQFGSVAPGLLGLERVQVCPISGLPRSANCPGSTAEWLPASHTTQVCDWHRRVGVDTRNGLLAGPACPNAVVEQRQYEYYPAEFTQWAHAAGRPVGPAESSPHCPLPAAIEAGRLQIVSPLDGARFVIDPDRPRELQRLSITVASSGGRARVRLEIDGLPEVELDQVQRLNWQLEAGDHTFVAVSDRGERSTPVHIKVRATE